MPLCCGSSARRRARSRVLTGNKKPSERGCGGLTDSELIEREVELLEKNEILFKTYLINDGNLEETYNADIKTIVIEYIDDILSEVLNSKIRCLRDKNVSIIAVHAIYCSDSLYEKWSASTYPLFSGLLICYILRTMRKTFEDSHEVAMGERYMKQENEFETHVCDLLEAAYRRNEKIAKEALKTDYHSLIERNHAHVANCNSLSLLDLAMKAKSEKFLDHCLCRKLASERWTPEISVTRKWFLFAFFFFIPVFFTKFTKKKKPLDRWAKRKSLRTPRGSIPSPDRIERRRRFTLKQQMHKNLKKMSTFYKSPCSNFTVHTIAYFLYIGLFATVLLTRGHKSVRFSEDILHVFIKEILLVVWQGAFIVDSIVAIWMSGGGYRTWIYYNPADFFHNILNASWVLLLFISLLFHQLHIVAVWGILSVLSKFIFHVSFIFSAVRIMRVFAADSFFGAVVVMMKRMSRQLWSFLIVFLLFWATYAVAVVSLQGEAPMFTDLPWLLFSNGAFEIFGELTDDSRTGNVTDCPSILDWSDIRDHTINCLFRTWMIPLLLFVYVFVSSVLLVNLVTSFFTNTFEKVQESSLLHYRYKFYQRVVEFETKVRCPPPFSIIFYIFWSIYEGVVMLKKQLKRVAELMKRDEEPDECRHVESGGARRVQILDMPETFPLTEMSPDEISPRDDLVDVPSDLNKDYAEIIKFLQRVMHRMNKKDGDEVTRQPTVKDRSRVIRVRGNGLRRGRTGQALETLSAEGSIFGYWKMQENGKTKLVMTQSTTLPIVHKRGGKTYYTFQLT